MTKPRMRLAAVLAAGLAVAGSAGAALADDDRGGGGRDNVATATAQGDGARAFRFRWSLREQRAGTVTNRNTATATASCANCRATAIGFQIVLVSGKPRSVKPFNQAVAVNDNCTGCQAYAGARQFVRVTDSPVRVTRAGQAELSDVQADLKALEQGDQTAGQLAAAVEAQEQRVTKVLASELERRDGKGRARGLDDDREADDGD